MPARFIVAALSVVMLVGCATAVTPPPTPNVPVIVLRTQSPRSPDACPAARIEGVLVRHPDSGVGLRDPDGIVHQVIWPSGYIAHDDDGRFVVIDETGRKVAQEGDHVSIGGQDVGGPWFGCGGVTVLAP